MFTQDFLIMKNISTFNNVAMFALVLMSHFDVLPSLHALIFFIIFLVINLVIYNLQQQSE